MNLHDFVAYDKKTNAKTHSSLFFINFESDGGAASIEETIKHIENENYVCMFTGLKDKNGTKIYEGDILSGYVGYGAGFSSKPSKKAEFEVVLHDCGGTQTYGFHLNPTKEITGNYRGYPNMTRCEVIGNRYQNPELINQE